jgi:hypothetical protein
MRDAQGHAHYGGLETCRRVWLCPVCATRISARRAQELHKQIESWMSKGGAVWFLTLTFPHDYADALSVSAALAAKAFRATRQGRASKEMSRRFGIAGFVRALEVTIGQNGWHPHLHALVFLKRPRGVRARRALQAALFERFAGFVERAGFRRPDPRNCPLEVVENAKVGEYVAKASGTAREMTAGHLKGGRGESRTPMQLLVDAINGDVEARERWIEYERGMHGRRQLTYTLGLRDVLGREDDAPVVTEESGDEEVLALLAMEAVAIEPSLWRSISDVEGLDRDLLAAFADGGFPSAVKCLRDGLGGLVEAQEIETEFYCLNAPSGLGTAA